MKKRADTRLFLLGGAVWLLAIILKVALDLTVTSSLGRFFSGFLPYTIFLVFWPLYYGLRTGLFECVIPYLYAKKAGIRKPSFEEAVAFGLGFGCSEAVALGILSLASVGFLFLSPSAAASLPPVSAAALQVQSDNALLFSAAAIVERVCAVAIHLVSALLIFTALNTRKPAFLLEAVVLKSVLDAVIVVVGGMDLPPVEKVLAVEALVVLLGLISVLAIMKLSAMDVLKGRTEFAGE